MVPQQDWKSAQGKRGAPTAESRGSGKKPPFPPGLGYILGYVWSPKGNNSILRNRKNQGALPEPVLLKLFSVLSATHAKKEGTESIVPLLRSFLARPSTQTKEGFRSVHLGQWSENMGVSFLQCFHCAAKKGMQATPYKLTAVFRT